MSRSMYGRSKLSGLIDSDSEDSQVVMPTPDSAAENKAPAKARGRPKINAAKVTKPKATGRRTSGRLTAKAKAPEAKNSKRLALADKTNHQHASDTEEVEEFEQNEDTIMACASSGDELDVTVTVKNAKVKAPKKIGRPKASKEANSKSYDEAAGSPDNSRLESHETKRKAQGRRRVPGETSQEKIVLESQVKGAEIEDFMDGEVEHVVSKSARSASNVRVHSRPPPPSIQRRRAGSASDTERSDPAIRRKLGEITKKFENLNVKYQDLREIGLKEAERNFDRLKKQGEERTNAANELIASLKADLASQSALAKEARGLKKKVESQTGEVAVLRDQIAQLTRSLSEAQTENKTLSAKLTANRTVAASVESANTKVPGSAVKNNGGIRMIGTAEAVQAAQAAQLKEDLYSDLSGLIIRSVKRGSEEDVFDCIQTGRNGSLHFKLAVANEKMADSYDDAQCVYVPQLDPSRDKALMNLLPDYLVDEITFPRPQAAKFYARVVKALTEKAV